MHTTVIDTPTGLVEIEVDDHQLVGLNFVETSLAGRDDPSGMADALRRYFDGDLDAIADLPVRFDTGTPFQQEVWRANSP